MIMGRPTFNHDGHCLVYSVFVYEVPAPQWVSRGCPRRSRDLQIYVESLMLNGVYGHGEKTRRISLGIKPP